MKGNIITAIDQLGEVRAKISDLRVREKSLELDIKEAIYNDKIGASQSVDGELFRVTLVVSFRESLIAEKVRELLHVNTLRACTRVTEVHSLRVEARSTAKLRVAA